MDSPGSRGVSMCWSNRRDVVEFTYRLHWKIFRFSTGARVDIPHEGPNTRKDVYGWWRILE